MKKNLIAILFLISSSIIAQNFGIINNQATHFKLGFKNDTIEFIVVDTELNTRKPIFLFVQGSQPKPLFIEFEKDDIFLFGGGISNFDLKTIKEEYHIVVISMPKTPIIVKQETLSPDFNYISNLNDPNSYLVEFQKADYLENYVNRANKVLEYLKNQEWVDHEKLVIAGHSQGSKIASKIASTNNTVTHLGLFAYNPFGRIDQMIRAEKEKAKFGIISWEEADKNIIELYEFWRTINLEGNTKEQPDLIAWKSFSQPTYQNLLSIDIPIYIANGTEDKTADLCDLLPLIFISNRRDNLTLKRKYGLEHNFFELKEDGRTNHEKGHWKEVMNEFIEWTAE